MIYQCRLFDMDGKENHSRVKVLANKLGIDHARMRTPVEIEVFGAPPPYCGFDAQRTIDEYKADRPNIEAELRSPLDE